MESRKASPSGLHPWTKTGLSWHMLHVLARCHHLLGESCLPSLLMFTPWDISTIWMSIGTVFEELLGKPDTMSWDVISHLGLEMARKCQKLHGCGSGTDCHCCFRALQERVFQQGLHENWLSSSGDWVIRWQDRRRSSREAIAIVLTKYCGGPEWRND